MPRLATILPHESRRNTGAKPSRFPGFAKTVFPMHYPPDVSRADLGGTQLFPSRSGF